MLNGKIVVLLVTLIAPTFGYGMDVTAVPDIPLLPVFRGYEGIGFRKLFGAIA